MYYFRTVVGTFWIRPHDEFPDRVRLGIDADALATFHSPAAAAAAVLAHTTGCAAWDTRGDLQAPADPTGWTAGAPGQG
jgi:hypothetical protein